MVQIFGWLSADAALASPRNRSSRRPSVPAESRQRLPVLRHILRKELQCYEAVKASVLGLVYDSHASAAELFDDAVVRDNLTNHSFPRAGLKSYGRLSVKSTDWLGGDLLGSGAWCG